MLQDLVVSYNKKIVSITANLVTSKEIDVIFFFFNFALQIRDKNSTQWVRFFYSLVHFEIKRNKHTDTTIAIFYVPSNSLGLKYFDVSLCTVWENMFSLPYAYSQ